ncbi:MAG: acetolactate synthase large subunit [Pseudomonadales bacterium]
MPTWWRNWMPVLRRNRAPCFIFTFLEFFMNGAKALIDTLVANDVTVCFANPGTSEMHLVQALDAVPAMRGVLCLFEGVCTGAADGYGRMRGTPATTLLHLGAGLANGVANLHNARRANAPIINLIGDHAVHHVAFDAPLTSDIEGIAAPVSAWVRTARTAGGLAGDAMDALLATLDARPNPAGAIATLIIPADCAWGDSHGPDGRSVSAVRAPEPVSSGAVRSAAASLGSQSLLLLDGTALSDAGLQAAARIAAKTGAAVFSTTFPARVDGGPGRLPIKKMPYFPEHVQKTLARFDAMVLAGAQAPVSFFAYPETPSSLVPADMPVVRLSHRHEDSVAALQALADELDAPMVTVPGHDPVRPDIPSGALSTGAISTMIAATAPQDSIVAVDSGGGGAAYVPMQQAVRHSWLNLTGGAIGQGGPVAVGAAVACPERSVYALLGDGGAGYTNQFLWTAAREKLDITVIVYSNRSYNILDVEYRRLGVNDVGDRAAALFALDDPPIDWTAMATAFGVPAIRADDCAQFLAGLETARETPGPFLIEATVTARD